MSYIRFLSALIAVIISASLFTPTTEARDAPIYVVSHQCPSGVPIRVVTTDPQLQHALKELFTGSITPQQFIGFMSDYSPKDLQ